MCVCERKRRREARGKGESECIQGEGTAIKSRVGQTYEMTGSACVRMGDGVTMERATP